MDLTVNQLFKEQITRLGCSMLPPDFRGDVRQARITKDFIARIIDSLGMLSATAQGLNKVITTAEKLYNEPTHILYLIKDPKGQNGQGAVVGFLKVGCKHLYLFDERERSHEVDPVCVLDFYVHQDCQRQGYGKTLFDHMLKDMESKPVELAIDGPSDKMESFLRKNYGIVRLLRQSNNFAVAPEFFQGTDKPGLGRLTPSPAPTAVGRFAAHKPASAIATLLQWQ